MLSFIFRLAPSIPCMFLVMIVMVFPGEMALAASDGGHQTWATTDWARVLNFAILFVFLLFLFVKVGAPKLNERIARIRQQLEDLERKKREAEDKLIEYNQRLATLEKESEEIVAQYQKQGEEARSRILEESRKAAEKFESQARRSIEEEFSKAKKQLQNDVLEKALTRAEDLIRERIGSEDQNRLVNEYLEKVVVR